MTKKPAKTQKPKKPARKPKPAAADVPFAGMVTAMHPATVPLGQLRIDAVNVRSTGRGADDALIASIAAKGIVTPVTVRSNGKSGWQVTDGGRRVAALHAMMKARATAAGVAVDKAFPVPVTVREESDEEARDTSLLSNIVRAPMHPVDRFEAFHALVESGLPAEAIATRYAMKIREVEQALALGALAPVIRAAWRDETIDQREAEAFTLLAEHDEQAKLFARLRKQGHFNDYIIRREIAGDDRTASKNLKFVGEKAYLAAGGRIHRDLFGDRDVPADPALLAKLAGEKLQEKIAAIAAEGWAWVKAADDVPNRWSLGRTIQKKSDFKEADRKRFGVMVEVTHDGKLDVTYGWHAAKAKKPAKGKAGTKGAGNDTDDEAPALPKALAHRLSQVLTSAAAAAIATEPHVALAAMIAAFGEEIDTYESPVKLRLDRPWRGPAGGGAVDIDDVDGASEIVEASYADLFAAAMTLTPEQQLLQVAKVVATALDLTRDEGGSVTDDDLDDGARAAIVNALAPERLNETLRNGFDAGDYFGAINGAMRERAVAEAINADEAAKVGRMKKADAVAWCVANVPPTGWLPPELRTIHYAGPGAAAPATLSEAA